MSAKGITSVYSLTTVQSQRKNDPEDQYVFVNILNQHASLIMCDQEYFEHIFGAPRLYGKLDRTLLIDLYEQNDTIALELPLDQYHLTFDRPSQKYKLTRNLYYMDWLTRGTNFCLGTTNLNQAHLQIQSILSVDKEYSMLESDCLSFALALGREVVMNEQTPENQKRFEEFAQKVTVTKLPVESYVRRSPRGVSWCDWLISLLRSLGGV